MQFAVGSLFLRFLLALAMLAGTGWAHAASSGGSLAVSATVLSKNSCTFANGTAPALTFPSLDPSSLATVTVSTSASFTCKGSSSTATFFVTVGDGLHALTPGARRMQHATLATEFLPYTLTVTPLTGNAAKNVAQTLTFTGSVAPTDYQAAPAGSYSDTVVITLSP